jgi:hypothetical protein
VTLCIAGVPAPAAGFSQVDVYYVILAQFSAARH